MCPISQRFTFYYNKLTTSAPTYPASIPHANTNPAVSTAPAPAVLPPPASTPATIIPNPPTPSHPASTPTVSKSCVHLTFDNSKENDMIIIVSFNLICL